MGVVAQAGVVRYRIGLDAVVEFGGSPVLASLLKRVAGAPAASYVGDERGLEALASTLASAAQA